MYTEEWYLGHTAYHIGMSLLDNYFEFGSKEWWAWSNGWRAARKEKNETQRQDPTFGTS